EKCEVDRGESGSEQEPGPCVGVGHPRHRSQTGRRSAGHVNAAMRRLAAISPKRSYGRVSGRTHTTWSSAVRRRPRTWTDRKSTRLNSSHVKISYAVFCLTKKEDAGAALPLDR